MHQKHAVICACIIAAYREIGTEELSKMFDRRRQQQGSAPTEGRNVSVGSDSDGDGGGQRTGHNRREGQRKEGKDVSK